MSNELGFGDWYIREAPRTLAEIYGQDTIVNYFKQKVKTNSWDKSTMFIGNWGSGKTALAKILAKYIACKNKDADGNPCGKCPTCAAIERETYDRDVVYLNGEQMSAGEVDDILDKSLSFPAIRDAARVYIVDETQGLSSAAIQKFLSATQSPRAGVYFIFTAMSKLQGKNPGALQSRCKVWKMRTPNTEEVYLYLAGFIKSHKDLIDINAAPKEFWTEGMKFIAENSEMSFRKALQTLEQCYTGKIFDIQQIKETFDIISTEDAVRMLTELSNGVLSANVFNAITAAEYQDKYPLLLKVVSDAKLYQAFGKTTNVEEEKWREKGPREIAGGPHFEQLVSTIESLGKNAYIRRGDWQLAFSKLAFEIKNGQPPGVTPKVVRRKVS
jgi:DNA polymerase-3 subunit gamma/tau